MHCCIPTNLGSIDQKRTVAAAWIRRPSPGSPSQLATSVSERRCAVSISGTTVHTRETHAHGDGHVPLESDCSPVCCCHSFRYSLLQSLQCQPV